MIKGFVGVPGSGKTYESVEKILDNIKLGRKIYTNIEGLDVPECRLAIQEYCNIRDFQLETCLNHLTEEQAQQFWLHTEPGSLILIDEVHKLFSNRDWNTAENKYFTEWASTHRHEGYDVILITQDIEKIDKHARSLIEFTHLFAKINFIGNAVQKKYMCYTYHGDDHRGRPMTKNVRTYRQAVFNCYKSYAAEGIAEVDFMKRVNIFNHPIFYAIPLVLGLAVYLFSQGSFFTGDMFGAKKAQASIMEDVKNKNKEVKNETVSPEHKKMVPKGKQLAANQLLVSDHTKDPIDQINAYKMPNGSLIWTNNGYIPPNSRYIRNL